MRKRLHNIIKGEMRMRALSALCTLGGNKHTQTQPGPVPTISLLLSDSLRHFLRLTPSHDLRTIIPRPHLRPSLLPGATEELATLRATFPGVLPD